MSDLISREEVLERLQILKKFNTAEIIQDVIDAAEQQINFCSTAFDKEKVIEEIKNLGEKFCTSVKCSGDCQNCDHGVMMRLLIEIVEKGGKGRICANTAK